MFRFPTPTARAQFLAGCREAVPILAGTVPFGIVAGVACVAAGMSSLEAVALSLFVFSGVAQLVTAQMLAVDSPLAVTLGAALVLGLRHLMYSAALSPHLAHLPLTWRAGLSYLMTDQGFVAGVRHYGEPGDKSERHWHFLGFGATLYAVWQGSVAVGALAGTQVPASWGLDFVVVLTFLALLVPAMRTRADLAAATVAGATALLALGLPYRLSLVVASLAGIAAGFTLERLRAR